jgi:hypothetical protein
LVSTQTVVRALLKLEADVEAAVVEHRAAGRR